MQFLPTRRLNEISELRGATVVITLSRPAKANALDQATLRLLVEAIDRAEQEPAARAIVMIGEGRHFCAGADLKELSSDPPRSVRELLNAFREVTSRLESSPLITVGAAHGAARAGGLEILLACDAVVAAENASFGDAHLANGLLPGGGSSVRLPRTVGHARARWMILSAAAIYAPVALEWGLCMAVVPNDQLLDQSIKLAEGMAVGHPHAVARAKQMLKDASELPLSDALEAEIVSLEEFSTSDVFREGVAAFLTRRAAG